jgi:hypothetical protein
LVLGLLLRGGGDVSARRLGLRLPEGLRLRDLRLQDSSRVVKDGA